MEENTQEMENDVEKEKKTGLKKNLTTLNAWALSFGCAIGWGAFVMPGNTFLPMAGPLGALLGLAIGAVCMLIIAANFHYMGKKYPDTAGGSFTYTKNIFGYDHGFLCAWAFGLAYFSIFWANATAFVLIIRNLLGPVFQVGFHYSLAGYDIYFGEILVTIFIIVFFGFFSCRSQGLSRGVETLLAVVVVAGVVVISCVVFGKNETGLSGFLPAFSEGNNVPVEILNLVILAPWAFVGFESVTHSSEEYRFSYGKKGFPVMAGAIGAGVLVYGLMTLVSTLHIPERYADWKEYIDDAPNLSGAEALPVFHAVWVSFGKGGMVLLGVVIVAAVSTSLIGLYRAISRLLYAMSEEGIISENYSELNKNGIPVYAIKRIMLVSLVIPFVGRTAIGWITDILTISAALAYGYISACSYHTAKQEDDRKMKVLGLVGIIISVLFFCFPIIPNLWSLSSLASESYLLLVVWSILGFSFFRLVFQKDKKNRFGKSTVVWIALIFLIFFASTMWMRQSVHVTTQKVIEKTDAFMTRERASRETEEVLEKREQNFLSRQMEKISDTLMTNSLIQMALIFISLFLMFNIYSIMRKREMKLDHDRVQAEESSKAKTTFLSNMSHDIRTPMNAIVGYTNLARNPGTGEKEMKEYLNKIAMSSRHLLDLIDDVLEMSRIENGKMELNVSNEDLFDIMQGVEDMFAMQMEEKKIQFTVDAKHIMNRYVRCDRHRLNRVLLNLLSNALKFTSEGGCISVVMVQWKEAENGMASYEIRVKDSGIGMSEEFAAKVFQAFERERTSTVSGIQGTGLGMAITKNIVEIMGGKIHVKTKVGEGTEFIVFVRFETIEKEEFKKEKETGPAVKMPGQKLDFSKLKVLLVEDNEINQEIASLVLEEEGISVEIASNGEEGVEKLKDSKPGYFDVVLMDVQMPVMNGYEATKAIRGLENEALAKIPIIAMTANAYAEDIQNAEEAGMDGHIAKPFDPDKLLEVLAKILN